MRRHPKLPKMPLHRITTANKLVASAPFTAGSKIMSEGLRDPLFVNKRRQYMPTMTEIVQWLEAATEAFR